jgi:hypothetical protein
VDRSGAGALFKKYANKTYGECAEICTNTTGCHAFTSFGCTANKVCTGVPGSGCEIFIFKSSFLQIYNGTSGGCNEAGSNEKTYVKATTVFDYQESGIQTTIAWTDSSDWGNDALLEPNHTGVTYNTDNGTYFNFNGHADSQNTVDNCGSEPVQVDKENPTNTNQNSCGMMYIPKVFFDPATPLRIFEVEVTFRTTFQTNITGKMKHWIQNWALVDFDRSEWFHMSLNADDCVLLASTAGVDGTSDSTGTTALCDGEWHTVKNKFVIDYGPVSTQIIEVDGKIENIFYGKQMTGLGAGKLKRYGFIGDGSEADVENGVHNNRFFHGDIKAVKVAAWPFPSTSSTPWD